MLTYDMQQRNGRPLYEHLYRCLRADIEAGRLRYPMKLPAKREFARHLGVSVITVEGAYRQLVAEGYVEAQERRGHFVAPLDLPRDQERLHRELQRQIAAMRTGDMTGEEFAQAFLKREVEASGRRGAGGPREPGATREADATGGAGATGDAGATGEPGPTGDAGRTGEPGAAGDAGAWGEANATGSAGAPGEEMAPPMAARGVFPYKMWARAMRQVLSDESEASLQQALAPTGCLRLRQALARHLRELRGMEVSPDQIVVGAGAQTLYGLIVQLLGRQRTFALENPGYVRLAQVYRSNDVNVVPLELDREGIRVPLIRRAAASVVHCMPSHQLPTGLTMTARRRRELLAWAEEEPDRYLIEDDYDCEFRMQGRPVPSMQSVDRAGRVIYLNTFTNSLGPTFRIGYMVLPLPLMEEFKRRLGFYACTVGMLDQLTLARLMETGEYERHVNRRRTRYRALQDGFVEALRMGSLAPRIRFCNLGAGLHFLVQIDEERLMTPETALAQEEAVAAEARARGVSVVPLGRFDTARVLGVIEDRSTSILDPSARPLSLVVSLTALDEERVGSAAEALAAAVIAVAPEAVLADYVSRD